MMLQHWINEKIPITSPAIAMPLVFGAGNEGARAPVAGAVGGTFNPAVSPENSGKLDSDFHSAPSSARTLVCALARPSRIHCCICSTVTGPYSRPSAPMILYTLEPAL